MTGAKRVVGIYGGFGILLPIVVMSVDRLSAHGWWPEWVNYVWPTSYMLMASSGFHDAYVYEVIAVSVIANAMIYVLVGLVINRLFRGIRTFKR